MVSKSSSPTPRARTIAALTAAIAFAACYGLGLAVGRRPDPAWVFSLEATWVNHSTLIAWWLTWFGYAYILIPVCLILLGVAFVHRAWLARAIFAIVSLLLSWQGADLLQRHFMRPRRLDWVVKHETAFSYPSSHASICAGFYLLLAVFVWRSGWRYRRILGTLLVLLPLGILWSRLSLAAHYLTDLAGGTLWGATVVGALGALWPRNVFEGRSSSSLE
jgi:membrane-associated phospholipid phosphatase